MHISRKVLSLEQVFREILPLVQTSICVRDQWSPKEEPPSGKKTCNTLSSSQSVPRQ